MARVYLGIGSNLGSRKENCQLALKLLEHRGVRIGRSSSFHETAAWGVKDQPHFINQAVEADTDLSPRDLLRTLKEIEREMGRVPRERYGPRVIDLDILLYNEDVVREPDLRIPHPRMHERTFVLVPLAEIAPKVLHPLLGKRVRELLAELTSGEEH